MTVAAASDGRQSVRVFVWSALGIVPAKSGQIKETNQNPANQ
jgi:hypothetical protein